MNFFENQIDINNLQYLKYLNEDLGISSQPQVISFVGPGCSYKSWVAQHFLLAYKSGTPFLDQFPLIQVKNGTGKTAHLDLEQGSNRVAFRYSALCKGYGIDPVNLPQFSSSKELKLSDPNVQENFINSLKDIDVLVIDSFRKWTSGKDEACSKEMQEALDVLNNVAAESKCIIIFIHHSSKKGYGDNAGRGSTVIYDDVSNSFNFTKMKDSVKFTQSKGRDQIKESKILTLKMICVSETETRIDAELLIPSVKDSVSFKIINFISENPNSNISQIEEAIGVTRQTIAKELKVLLKTNPTLIEKKSGNNKFYSITTNEF